MSAAHRITPAQIATARERASLPDLIGRKVKLVKRGAEFVGLCPFHNEKTPSFHVIPAKGFYTCFGCGAHGDAIKWTMETTGVPFLEAVAALNGGVVLPDAEIARIHTERARAIDDRKRSIREIARELWRASTAISGTPGEAYFRLRGVRIPLPPTLRYNSAVALGTRETRIWLPAVVAAVKGPEGKIDAVHRIFLDPGSIAAGKPRKAEIEKGKALLGTVKGGAVRFAPAAAVMATCEGLETGASVLQALPETALWAGIDATHMAAIAWPDLVRELVIYADRDLASTKPGKFFDKKPGDYWAERAAARFISSAEGRRAHIALPPPRGGPRDKSDFNDLLPGGTVT